MINRTAGLPRSFAGESDNDRPAQDLVPAGRPTAFVPDAGAAAVASAHAPFVFFDVATVSGINSGGVCHITLEAIRHMSGGAGEPLKDFVATAHLRFDLNALRTLKQAISQIETLVRPGPAAVRN